MNSFLDSWHTASATGDGVLVMNPTHGIWITSMIRGSMVRFQIISLTSKAKRLRKSSLLVVFAGSVSEAIVHEL
jgi:hypothetical protein